MTPVEELAHLHQQIIIKEQEKAGVVDELVYVTRLDLIKAKHGAYYTLVQTEKYNHFTLFNEQGACVSDGASQVVQSYCRLRNIVAEQIVAPYDKV